MCAIILRGKLVEIFYKNMFMYIHNEIQKNYFQLMKDEEKGSGNVEMKDEIRAFRGSN